MVYCFAYDCKNGHRSGKSTYAFPPNTPPKRELRNKWIVACNRRKEDIENSTYPRLCEDLFSPDAFNKIPELARQLGYRLYLKPDVVPDPSRFTRRQVNSDHGSQQKMDDKKWKEKKKEFSFSKEAES